ncbi:unnamed protein product [Pleuronectes platessa]|uniref:Myb/SANT-like DNA-binding domain-containing protein n=1 Tax=Pleuronectes platessa TaxID=8262 RepID=A0A9N7ZC45_PLEPL|nr:unnamed protein product [Pleuronectes platessa]
MLGEGQHGGAQPQENVCAFEAGEQKAAQRSLRSESAQFGCSRQSEVSGDAPRKEGASSAIFLTLFRPDQDQPLLQGEEPGLGTQSRASRNLRRGFRGAVEGEVEVEPCRPHGVRVLLEAVKRNRYIILRKFNQGVSAETKKQTWCEITNQINGLGENHREVRQIMKKWADLKVRREATHRDPQGPERQQPEEEEPGPRGEDGA